MACAGLCVSWSQQTEPNYLNPAWTSENEQTGKGYYITDTACLSLSQDLMYLNTLNTSVFNHLTKDK